MVDQTESLRNWLALSFAPGVGPAKYHKLLAHFDSAEAILAAGESAWRQINLSDDLIRYLKQPDWDKVDDTVNWANSESSVNILTLEHEAYPSLLKEISDPPPVLYIRGNLEALGLPQFAMVGSRNPSHAGKENALNFSSHLARMGLAITSGLAMGIDAASHQGTVNVSGTTIAVVGTGLDRVYPAKNRELAHKIIENGAIVTEFAPGVPPLPGNFPRRNRIISGMSMGVLVVEAAIQSGSLITARQALEQGREVFAIPGSIHHPLARGCHRLIREGAKLVESAEDIFEELGGMGAFVLEESRKNTTGMSSVDLNKLPELDAEYKNVLECVDFAPTSVDKVVERSGLTADAVCSMLLVLELQGYVKALSGGYYSQHG